MGSRVKKRARAAICRRVKWAPPKSLSVKPGTGLPRRCKPAGRMGARGQGLLPFAIDADATTMALTAHAGLTLVAEALLALGVDELVGRGLRVRKRRRGFSEFEKLQAIVLVLAAGGERVEDVRVLARDEGLSTLLGRKFPSPDALHDFLGGFHDEEIEKQRPEEGAWIAPESESLARLAEVNGKVVRRIAGLLGLTQATLDLDATIIEAHKRDALAHYKGGRGYQPTSVVWSEADLIVADEFRDGNVPAGMNPLEVAKRALEVLPQGVTTRRFRGDSACYEEHLLKHLAGRLIPFTISADMTKALKQVCVEVRDWRLFEERLDETVELAEIEFTPGDWPKKAEPLRYVALKFRRKQEALFSDGNAEKHLSVVSNRRDLAAPDLVRWHWGKAGTIELVHDVTKNDLGQRLMPSGRFGANAAWYRLGVLTYNVLTALRRIALPERFARARPKRLRFELFAISAELQTHARQLSARVGVDALTRDELIAARQRLLAVHDRLHEGQQETL